MADSTSVKLREGSDGELVELRADGSERTYYPRRTNISFVCSELHAGQTFARRVDEDASIPTMESWVDGVAWLEGDDGLSVIGEPSNRTRRVGVQFKPDARSDLLKAHPSDPMEWHGQPNGRATLAFVRADWEIGSSDTWFVSCYVNPAALKPFIDSVLAGTVKKVAFNLRLGELYCDEPPYVPYDSAELFLRPEKGSNSLKHPELANGFLEGLRLDFASIDLLPQEPAPVKDSLSDESSVSTEQAPEPLLVALELLAVRTEAMRGTLKWVGGFIAAALFIIACRL